MKETINLLVSSLINYIKHQTDLSMDIIRSLTAKDERQRWIKVKTCTQGEFNIQYRENLLSFNYLTKLNKFNASSSSTAFEDISSAHSMMCAAMFYPQH